jgi:RNA polymerase sigma-70 factor, ECF subfamily
MSIPENQASAGRRMATVNRALMPALTGEIEIEEESAEPFLLEEERKIERPAQGLNSEEQILALYDEYRPRLYRYIRSLGIYRDLVDEIIQEAFLRLTAQLLAGREIGNPQGYIVRVAHNLAVRQRKEVRQETASVPQPGQKKIHQNEQPDPENNPEQAYLEKEQRMRMRSALKKLTPRQQHGFLMRAQGFRYQDIALALGISEQSAHELVRRAAERLEAICG